MRKALAIQTWLPKAETGELLQEGLDLSHLFHPETFLNAFRQQTARYKAKKIDFLLLFVNVF